MTQIRPAADLRDITVAVDLSIVVVPFAVGYEQLDVALVQRTEPATTLPTGVLEAGESLGHSAARIVATALQIAPDYLEQLYTFSVARPRLAVIVSYFALLSAETRDRLERLASAELHDAENLPAMSSSDRGVVDYAKTRLRAKLGYSNVGFHLLPREFTLSDLQEVYQSVIGEQLDKRNFRRRVLGSGLLEAVGTTRASGHRPAALYRFAGGDPAIGALTPNESDWSV